MGILITPSSKKRHKKPKSDYVPEGGKLDKLIQDNAAPSFFVRSYDPAGAKPTQIQRTRVNGKTIIAATHWKDSKSHEQEAADIFAAKKEQITSRMDKGLAFHERVEEGRVEFDQSEASVYKDTRSHKQAPKPQKVESGD
jgi:hypothetical protein